MATLLECLRKLRDEGPVWETDGICSNVLEYHARLTGTLYAEACNGPVWDALKKNVFEAMGLDQSYPVTHPDFEDNEEAFHNSLGMWEGVYGERRMALVRRVIDYLECRAFAAQPMRA